MWKRTLFQTEKFTRCKLECQWPKYISSTVTVDSSELKQFKQFSETWWSKNGPMKPLHSMNKLRVPLIRDGLINTHTASQIYINSSTPLRELSVLDVGCGGGILTECLARIGSNVVGLDASPDLIKIAIAHANSERLQNIQYVCSSIEEHARSNSEKYDAVVSSEVIEHVTQKQDFLNSCLKCLKPGGSIFLTTLSKTFLANFLAIFLSENVLYITPNGTHEYSKFIEPHKLQRLLEEENCKTVLIHGFVYNLFTNEWSWCRFKDVSYCIHAIKLPSN